jgi:putative transposase
MNKSQRQQLQDSVYNDFLKGIDVDVIGKNYKLKKSTIYSWINQKEAIMQDKSTVYSQKERSMIVLKVLSGISVKSLCVDYNLKQSTVYLWTRKYRKSLLNEPKSKRAYSTDQIERLKTINALLESTSITHDMNAFEKQALITSLREKYPLKLLCEVFNYSRSTYYYHHHTKMTIHQKRDQLLKKKIIIVFLKHNKRIGGVKIRYEMVLNGVTISIRKMYQLMQDMGISDQSKKKPAFVRPPKRTNENCKNLLNQQFTQKAPNLVWVSDITEIKINKKPVYLCAILDLFSRKIIAHQVSRKCNTRLTLLTFDLAMENRETKPHMFHSDRGVQYTSEVFQAYLRKKEISQSFSAPGYPYDNSVMESFFANFKKEAIYLRQAFRTIQDYIKHVNEYMNYYNTQRYHNGIGLLTPKRKEEIYYSVNLV